MASDPTSDTRPFNRTRWTLVLRASTGSPQGRAALSELCAAYYRPVFVFLRRLGYQEDTARDHTHAFFAHLMTHGFPNVDPQRGRFRSYLLAAVKYFVRDLNQRARRARRGGGAWHLTIDPTGGDSGALNVPDAAVAAGPEIFDREWAVTIMNRAVASVAAGQPEERFAVLRPWLMGDAAGSQAEAAEALGMTGGAFKVAVHRLRKRFRKQLQLEVAQTVDDDADIEDELRYLCSVLAR